MTNARAVVVIDYQNIHLTAHERWGPAGAMKHETLVHPLHFANQVLRKRAAILGAKAAAGEEVRFATVDLLQVLVYRGCPSNKHNPQAYARSQAQRAEWTRDPRVEVDYRTLKYYGYGDPPREKGVDVKVALNVVRVASDPNVEVVILAAHDTDQEPALEMAADVCAENGTEVETAGWQGCKILRPRCGRKLWHTALTGGAFVNSRDRKEYS